MTEPVCVSPSFSNCCILKQSLNVTFKCPSLWPLRGKAHLPALLLPQGLHIPGAETPPTSVTCLLPADDQQGEVPERGQTGAEEAILKIKEEQQARREREEPFF